MSKILILHGPEPEEITKAIKISKIFADYGHDLVPLTNLSLKIKNTPLTLSSFLDRSEAEDWLVNFIPTLSGQSTISLANFLIEAIEAHDRVIILPSPYVIRFESFILAIGYALGGGKIFASLNYSPEVDLQEWYEEMTSNIPTSKPGLSHKLKRL